jgi:hypothetical protein
MFQDLTLHERLLKINKWLSKNFTNRSEVLTKAVEVCLRARDAAEKAQSERFKNIKSSEEKAMIAHIEKLIENA